jgi:hemerythrin superfamily protein
LLNTLDAATASDYRSTPMATAKKSANKPAATARAAKTDATVLLQRDHSDVKKLFKQYEKLADAEADGAQRQALATQICTMLTVHATIEEEIFYPAARAAGVDAGVLAEAEVEHASAKDLIAQIRDMEPEAPLYDAKVRVLGEYIDHHVGEEERELFPKCRAATMDLNDLGIRIATRKDELMSEMSEGLEVVG